MQSSLPSISQLLSSGQSRYSRCHPVAQDLQQDAILFKEVFGGRHQTLLDERNDQVHETPGRFFGNSDKFGSEHDE